MGGCFVGRGWWVVGRGSCLLEDKKKYISSLGARSKFAIILPAHEFTFNIGVRVCRE